MSDRGNPAADLALGVRLAVAGGRSGWVRLALTALGIALGTTLLLTAASVPAGLRARDVRELRVMADVGPVRPGRDPLYLQAAADFYRGRYIDLDYVEVGGAHPPMPPGVRRLPGPGEMVVSPALADLLAGPGGALLRQRHPERVIGTIAAAGLVTPVDLNAFVGATGLPRNEAVIRFGQPQVRMSDPLSPLLWVLLVVGVVVLLAPVFVFVAISARFSGAERDRTLAALRLVGASAAQTRWIAAGEALAGSVAGVLAGGVLFLLARPLAETQGIAGVWVFAADLAPAWPVAVAIGAGVPVLAVAATLAGLRRTVIEPLGVTRRVITPRRHLWWRPLAPLAGAALLLLLMRQGLGEVRTPGSATTVILVGGVVLLLLGVPALLPWLVERMIGRTRAGSPALALATGRLRLDGGTAARVVAGLGVVLAGAIALSTLLVTSARIYDPVTATAAAPAGPPAVRVRLDASALPLAPSVEDDLRRLPGVTPAGVIRQYEVARDTSTDTMALAVATCDTVRDRWHVASCRDGQAFVLPGTDGLTAGRPVQVQGTTQGVAVPWVLPALTPLPTQPPGAMVPELVATPAAVPDLGALSPTGQLTLTYDPAVPDIRERILTATGRLQWRAWVSFDDPAPVAMATSDRYLSIRRGLLAGTLLTLGLAAATMVVSSVEQVRERRRPLAALAATGVPRALLARSLLWQNAIPLVAAVAVADLIGLLLAWLLVPLTGNPVTVDGAAIATYSAAAALAAALATGLSLPAVARATRPTGLRAE